MEAHTTVRSWFRLRETHVRDHLAPMLAKGASGLVAVDLLLRGLAAAGDAEGRLDPELSWEQLHDAARSGNYRTTDVVLKRKWVSDKLRQLEDLQLIAREEQAGSRPRVVVLTDSGDGRRFDDPGATPDSYVTVFGSGLQQGAAAGWGSPQWAAYLAALIAERYARADPLFRPLMEASSLGDGMWFRSLSWFKDEAMVRPGHHIRVPFSERTLRRGTLLLRQEGWLATRRIWADPRTGRRFANDHSRLLYFNGFGDMRPRLGAGRAELRAQRFGGVLASTIQD